MPEPEIYAESRGTGKNLRKIRIYTMTILSANMDSYVVIAL